LTVWFVKVIIPIVNALFALSVLLLLIWRPGSARLQHNPERAILKPGDGEAEMKVNPSTRTAMTVAAVGALLIGALGPGCLSWALFGKSINHKGH